MIDEKTDEILSRYLDGDLGSEEERRFGERLERDPALVEALQEMRSLRLSLRRLALAERPPEALDQMVRPLRRAGRPWRQRCLLGTHGHARCDRFGIREISYQVEMRDQLPQCKLRQLVSQ
ncbi:MAG: hypothetical protein ABFS37_12435 [Acidobacteriota bacterium]